MDIGAKLKRLRLKNGLTMEELANRSEVTKGFVSQLERDLTSPNVAALADILEALGTNLQEFFSEEEENQIVFNSDDFFINEQDDFTINYIVPNAQKNHMEPILINIKPSQKSMFINPHEGEEFGYVLSGSITLCFGEERYKVKKGETFYLAGNKGHYLLNNQSKEAKVIWVSNPPLF
ncbi:MAG: XRE family transcriptional regulator [Thomasclavelia sp.]|nr:XRE family transcriptional regulator [Thomasclavelia sp.]